MDEVVEYSDPRIYVYLEKDVSLHVIDDFGDLQRVPNWIWYYGHPSLNQQEH